MASGDFSTSVLQRLNVEFEEMFNEPNTARTEFIQPAAVAKALLENQTATADERLESDKCVGVKAWFIRASSIGAVSASTDCTIPGGNEAETVSKNFDSAPLAHAAGTAKDHRCNNEVNFIDESKIVLKKIVTDLDRQTNELAIARLAAASQVNLDTGIDPNWDDTTESPRILVPQADFTWENLGEFNALVANNNFGNHFWISGRNFYKDYWQATMRTFNDNERSNLKGYESVGGMYFDLRDLDRLMTWKSSFAVDENSYLFWNTATGSSTPTMVDTNVWEWLVPSPVLTYNKNGRMVPVMYKIEMQKTCLTRTSLGDRQYSYKYYGRLVGGLEWAPTGPNGEKGVLQFKAA